MKNKKEKKGFNRSFLMILAIPILVAIGVLVRSYLDGSTSIFRGDEMEETAVPEVTVPLEEFLLNLEPSNNSHNYVRLEVSISSIHKDGEETINENVDKIRDSIIHTVSRLSIQDVYHEEAGTGKLKSILKESLNNLFDDPIVHDVYITNIIVQ